MFKVYFSLIIILATLAGWSLDIPDKLLVGVAGGLLIHAVRFDLATLRIPNRLNLMFALAMLGGTFINAAIVPAISRIFSSELAPLEWGSFGRAVLAGVATMIIFLIAHLIHPKGLGMGDVKLAFGLGVFLGWFSIGALFLGMMAAFILNGISAVVLICLTARRKKSAGRKEPEEEKKSVEKKEPRTDLVLPFVPALALGSFLGIFLFNILG